MRNRDLHRETKKNKDELSKGKIKSYILLFISNIKENGLFKIIIPAN